jgi:uncharacterized protein involved in response to NO
MAWLGLHSMNIEVRRPTIAGAPHLWHGHEMIFGYATAVISGFILTAVPNWTGARRVAGTPLALLVLLWLAGRAAMWFSGFLPAALVAALDMAHLPALILLVALGLFVRPAPRNLVFLLLLTLLVGANAAVHAEWLGLTENSAAGGLAFGLMTISLLVVIIGGRVVPSFTRNALMRESGMQSLPRSFPVLDRAAILASALLVACYLPALPGFVTGAIALAAALLNGARLAFWRSAAVLGEPILWSLHIAYAWIAVGYAALASAHLTGSPHETAALHIIAIGAIGGMTLAVMTRAALGHTGRPLSVSRPIAIAYGLIAVAAAVRGFGPGLLPSHYFALIFLSGGLWISGFAIFAIGYCSILTGPPLPKRQTAG